MSIALLKRNALAAPFELGFRTQKELESSGGTQGQLMEIHYRDEEAIYLQASPDRVTVIFSTVFQDETDRIFGKVFLQVRCRDTIHVLSGTSASNWSHTLGIRRCPTPTLYSERAPSSLLESRTPAGNPSFAWPAQHRRCRLCHVRFVPPPLQQRRYCIIDHLPYSTVP